MSVPNIKAEVNKTIREIKREVKSRAVRGSRVLKNTEIHILSGQRSGRVYKKSGKKTSYTASAPGEPPAVRSGKLRRSFRAVSKASAGSATAKVAIETDTHYAGYLEYGTRKMAARPYVDKIMEEAEPEITKIFNEPYNV